MNPGRVTLEKKLYDLPGYSDGAFSYDHSGEIPFFTCCFQTYADGVSAASWAISTSC